VVIVPRSISRGNGATLFALCQCNGTRRFETKKATHCWNPRFCKVPTLQYRERTRVLVRGSKLCLLFIRRCIFGGAANAVVQDIVIVFCSSNSGRAYSVSSWMVTYAIGGCARGAPSRRWTCRTRRRVPRVWSCTVRTRERLALVAELEYSSMQRATS
jgi:hypothetical protein